MLKNIRVRDEILVEAGDLTITGPADLDSGRKSPSF